MKPPSIKITQLILKLKLKKGGIGSRNRTTIRQTKVKTNIPRKGKELSE